MLNEQVGHTEKQNSKRRLIPLVAAVVGLCVPIYAYAYDQAACDACHTQCNNNAGYYGSQCSAMYPGCPEAISSCVSSMMNACHSQCGATACNGYH